MSAGLGIPLQYLESQFPEEYRKWKASPDRARYRIPGACLLRAHTHTGDHWLRRPPATIALPIALVGVQAASR